MTQKENVMSIANVIINTILLLWSVFTITYTSYFKVDNNIFYGMAVFLIIILLQMVSIFLSNNYKKLIEESIFQMDKKQLFEKSKPYSQSISIQNARDELRFGLHILLSVVTVVCLCLCINCQSALLFIAAMSIIVLAYMYADYIPNAVMYAQLYDKQFIGDKEKANAIRGLARIYLDEYRKTSFNRKHKFYKELSEYHFEKDNKKNKEKNEDIDNCIKNILFMQMDSIRCPEIVHSIILLFINIVLVIPNALDNLIVDFIGNEGNNILFIKMILSMIINIIFAIINIYTSVNYRNICEAVKKLSDVISKENGRKKRIQKYNECRNNSPRKFEAIRVRGIYVFCSDNISKGRTLDHIPMQCRMLYIHKLYTNINRFQITVILLTISLISLLFEYNATRAIIIFLLLLDLILAELFKMFYLPNIGKKEIANWCNKLIKMEDKHKQNV